MARDVIYDVVAAQNVATYNVAMATADTEYTQLLPDGTRIIEIKCQDGTAIRWAWETGKVATPTAPFHTLLTNDTKRLENVFLVGKTIYLACDTTSKIAEIEVFY